MIDPGWYKYVAPVAAGAIVSAFSTWVLSIRNIPAAYRVAVLGFPRSGKTTLITAVFAYLFRQGVRGASIVPRGDETIQRINANMEQLELGRPVMPTTDQDVFAYRAEVKLNSVLFSRTYKLEIGDFPGEDTIAFTEEYGDWLHRTRYFQWAVGSDAFIFVVDTARILEDYSGEYVARQKRAFRAAWQRLQEEYLEGSGDLAKRPLLLVFTKADFLLNPEDAADSIPSDFRSRSQQSTSAADIKQLGRNIQERFSDLIEYFDRETKSFKVVFSSVYLDVNGDRLGIPELARAIMPRAVLWPAGSRSPSSPSGSVSSKSS